MFDFDASKLLIVGVIALIFIPPKDLPRVLRQVGQFVGKMRRMASEFQGQFMDAMREADMADLREEARKLADAAKVDVGLGAVADLGSHLTGAIEGRPVMMDAIPSQVDPVRDAGSGQPPQLAAEGGAAAAVPAGDAPEVRQAEVRQAEVRQAEIRQAEVRHAEAAATPGLPAEGGEQRRAEPVVEAPVMSPTA